MQGVQNLVSQLLELKGAVRLHEFIDMACQTNSMKIEEAQSREEARDADQGQVQSTSHVRSYSPSWVPVRKRNNCTVLEDCGYIVLQVARAVLAEAVCQTTPPAHYHSGTNIEAGLPGKCDVPSIENPKMASAVCSGALTVDDGVQIKLIDYGEQTAKAGAQTAAAENDELGGACIRNDSSCTPGAAIVNSARTPASTWGHIVPPKAWIGLLVAASKRNADLQALLGRLLVMLLQRLQQQKPTKNLVASSVVAVDSTSSGVILREQRASVPLMLRSGCGKLNSRVNGSATKPVKCRCWHRLSSDRLQLTGESSGIKY